MGHLEAVRRAADSLGMLDSQNRLVAVDSLMVWTLIERLEETWQISIPAAAVRLTYFRSLESLSAWIDELAAGAR